VDQNFHQNINLKSIASQFYMNTAYLGQLFKKSYGVYFNEYLLQLRIEEAKKLLKQSDMRVYEIADRVGFNSADYFVTRCLVGQGNAQNFSNVKLHKRNGSLKPAVCRDGRKIDPPVTCYLHFPSAHPSN